MSDPGDRWSEDVRDLLEAAYLAGDNPRAQSGFGGDDAHWQVARGVIAEAINGSGSFLDVGCASGHLMECMVDWSAAGGFAIEPYGLDILESMVGLARSRLPQWSGRIHLGDARSWEPPQRFDFVRTELMYAPDSDRPVLVAHLLDRVVAPSGRLILCSYGSRTRDDRRAEDLTEELAACGVALAGSSAVEIEGRLVTWVGWVDRP